MDLLLKEELVAVLNDGARYVLHQERANVLELSQLGAN